MRFTHRNAASGSIPDRFATVTETESPTAVMVEHVDASGKSRKKTFTSRAEFGARMQVTGQALRFLLREGYIVRAPQDGAIQWLTQTEEPYPHGFVATWMDGHVWLGDTGFLRRVTPGTCDQLDLPLGPLVMPRAIGASATHVHALLDLQTGSPDPSDNEPPFLAPRKGNLSYRAVRVEGESIRTLFDVPYRRGADIAGVLSVARDGRILGPHTDGVALYVNGEPEHVWSAAPTNHRGPDAAMSPDGNTIVITAPDGALRFEGSVPRTVATVFEQVLGLRVDDSGTAWVSGLGAESWGLYRVDADATLKVSDDPYATYVPEKEAVLEVNAFNIALRPLDGRSATLFPDFSRLGPSWLGMAKQGTLVHWNDGVAVVLTDANTIGGIQIGPD